MILLKSILQVILGIFYGEWGDPTNNLYVSLVQRSMQSGSFLKNIDFNRLPSNSAGMNFSKAQK